MAKKKQVDITPVEDILNCEYAPGKPSEILLNYAEGHYQKVYNGDGEMVFLDKHTQRTLKIPEDSKFFMEVLQGYDFLEG
jgi:hypothetical protein